MAKAILVVAPSQVKALPVLHRQQEIPMHNPTLTWPGFRHNLIYGKIPQLLYYSVNIRSLSSSQ